jgi:hypothetical protein
MVTYPRPSWSKCLLALGLFFSALLILVCCVPLVNCPNCTGTALTRGESFSRSFMLTTSRCWFCAYDRKVTILDAEATAWALLANGQVDRLTPNPGFPGFWLQLPERCALPMTGVFFLTGAVFILTRSRLIDCAKCPIVSAQEGICCERCGSKGSASFLRLWRTIQGTSPERA